MFYLYFFCLLRDVISFIRNSSFYAFVEGLTRTESESNAADLSGRLLTINDAVHAILKLACLPWGTASGSNLIIDNGYTVF